MAQPSPEILTRLNEHRIIIVGAGVSGLAAGVTLAGRGIVPLIIEQRQFPGGRAYSFPDPTTGEVVDNGQHVLLAGSAGTLRFLNAVNAFHHLAVQPTPSLLFHHPQRGFCHFSIPRWRSPFHLIAAVAGTNLLNVGDRGRLLRAGRTLYAGNRIPENSQTIAEWFDTSDQTGEARQSFWNPLTVSIMNELPQRAAIAPFLRSLRDAFARSWKNARLAIPRVGLSELYVEPACDFIRKRGGIILCGHDVSGILDDGLVVTGVRLRDGSEIQSDAVILSVPPHRISRLLPALHPLDGLRTICDAFSYSPIVSTHLWYPEDFMGHEFIGLVGRKTQWVFNRRRIFRDGKTDGHISAVISAAYDVVDLSNEEIVRLTLEDLGSVYGQRALYPTNSLVIREKRATISLTPSAEKQRPSQKTAIRNLFIGGDWTATGYPATIEGAVLSGERCAELAIEMLHENKP